MNQLKPRLKILPKIQPSAHRQDPPTSQLEPRLKNLLQAQREGQLIIQQMYPALVLQIIPLEGPHIFRPISQHLSPQDNRRTALQKLLQMIQQEHLQQDQLHYHQKNQHSPLRGDQLTDQAPCLQRNPGGSPSSQQMTQRGSPLLITSAVSITMIDTVDMWCAAQREGVAHARTFARSTGAVMTTPRYV